MRLRNLLRDHTTRRQVGLHRRPCWKTRGVVPRGPAADKALGKVSPRYVEIAKYATKHAGGEQVRDGLPNSVEDTLLGVVHETTMRVGAHWTNLVTVVGRRRDFQHGCRRPAMHRVFAYLARCIPRGERFREDVLAHVHGGGKLRMRVAPAQDATFELAQRFFAPC